ncbi:GDSL-type esterase/lipase family protein [Paraflavitalea sp. CAU 1676]|uniref:GDSL-type esterase/lipase family protein n=1 Tax=Paraflavitalea sp. CAU 1676 TaxID=3032598 RepID=UPI0023DAEC0B|nr:GDSL-type esterase/lipase family protein [Paraflavitalea sp. CAU 1676]MDF2186830.1 GDSL-type esterase/lipase family protein [Paraflavitalea sp. CAU 1676]
MHQESPSPALNRPRTVVRAFSFARVKRAASLLLIIIAIGSPCLLQAQDGLWSEIKAFKKQDSLQPPPKNAILFVGSSSFRMWRDVQNAFPGHTIINRGFGGSTLPDVIQYADDIIFPYQPKEVVIYCGENDISSSDTITSKTVFSRFEKLFTMIRKKMPKVPIVFVAMKPSPSREKYHQKLVQANQLIKTYLSRQKKAAYVDVYKLMLDNGKPDESLYGGDRLHMNAKGYAIWQKAIEPYLIK